MFKLETISEKKMTKCPVDAEGNQKVHAVKLSEYLQWITDSENDSSERPIKLPPIQRGFVWKPKQIQDLWDSLLRGMPIGALMIQKFTNKYAGGVPPEDREQKDNQSGYYLLDGQQRTLSMYLGFPSSMKSKHKLWIDFSEDGKDQNVFRFRVTTEYHPFGYRLNGRKLPLTSRRHARELWNGYNCSKECVDRQSKSNCEVFKLGAKPWKDNKSHACCLFEVADVWKYLQGEDDIERCVKSLLVKIEKECLIKKAEIEKISQRVSSFVKGLSKLQQQWLALIEVDEDLPESEQKNYAQGNDFLTMLFERISKGGTTLSSDDLLFSMIKQQWPEAHNLVSKIQKEVGVMLSSTGFVMTAFRLSYLKENKGCDVSSSKPPTGVDFHNHLAYLLGTESSPRALRKMLTKEGSLVGAFTCLKEELRYKGKGDIGLPSALLPYLDRTLLQVLLFWCLDKDEEVIKKNRDCIIRFVLFWLLCKPSGRGASRDIYRASSKLIDKLQKSDKNFPYQELYDFLTSPQEAKNSPVFSPLYKYEVKEFEIDAFREPSDRGKFFFGELEGLFGQFSSRKYLLLWLQREWVHSRYEKTDFLSGQDDDVVPYDFDHLVPQNDWSSFKGRSKNTEKVSGLCKSFKESWARRALGNSIGNYRVMDASENRSRGKSHLFTNDLEVPKEQEDYAFLPNDKEILKWKDAAVEEKTTIWNNERVLA